MKYSDTSARIAWALNQLPETTEDIASNLGINRNTVSRYKKGKADVKFSVVVGLHEKYGFKPHWLVTGRGSPQQIRKETIVEDLVVKEEPIAAKSKKPETPIKSGYLNQDLLLDIMKSVETTISKHIKNISLDKKAEVTFLLYKYL